MEYVDRGLLTELNDFHVKNSTVQGAIQTILGVKPALTIKLRDGIVQIGRKVPPANGNSVFDVVLPKWEAQRGPLQVVSLYLHMAFEIALDPKIAGFGGDIPAGDLKNQIGPFHEHNKSIRQLLDEIVAQSKGGTWLSQVPWNARRDYYVVGGHPRWTIVEYNDRSGDFGARVRAMAENLP
jgi:hypothetical protein